MQGFTTTHSLACLNSSATRSTEAALAYFGELADGILLGA